MKDVSLFAFPCSRASLSFEPGGHQSNFISPVLCCPVVLRVFQGAQPAAIGWQPSDHAVEGAHPSHGGFQAAPPSNGGC